jgi:hypothetical protein
MWRVTSCSSSKNERLNYEKKEKFSKSYSSLKKQILMLNICVCVCAREYHNIVLLSLYLLPVHHLDDFTWATKNITSSEIYIPYY